MIGDIALAHFDRLWELFDKNWLEFGGSQFLIEPFEHLFSQAFANELTEEDARYGLHRGLLRWGEIEQSEHDIEIVEELEFPDGGKMPLTRFKNPKVRWSRSFILTAFYSLCCLQANRASLEELIFKAVQARHATGFEKDQLVALRCLLGISKSFILAEWFQDLAHKALSNSDDGFFHKISLWLKQKSVPRERFGTIRPWLGTTLLWYLGGKDLPRREFMLLLRTKGILSRQADELTFNAMISNLKLIKGLDITE